MSNQRVTLRKGDYVSTAGMDEATYHAVARAFIEAGAIDTTSGGNCRRAVTGKVKHLVWDESDNRFFHTAFYRALTGRHLTIDQVLNATNAVGTTTPEPIAALRVAKTALENAREAYSKALDAVREELGEGFVLSEKGMLLDPADGTLQTVTLSEDVQPLEYTLGPKMRGWQEWPGGECPVDKGTLVDVRYRDGTESRSIAALEYDQLAPKLAMNWHHVAEPDDIVAWRLADEPDMTDPANWRAGDVVVCISTDKDYARDFEFGHTYTIHKGVNANGWVSCITKEGRNSLPYDHFAFHHRPNT